MDQKRKKQEKIGKKLIEMWNVNVVKRIEKVKKRNRFWANSDMFFWGARFDNCVFSSSGRRERIKSNIADARIITRRWKSITEACINWTKITNYYKKKKILNKNGKFIKIIEKDDAFVWVFLG